MFQMLDTLPIIPLFQGLTTIETDLLKPLFKAFSCRADTDIFGQGDPALYLYLILNGAVIIRYKPYDGAAMTLTRLRNGDVFGWSAVIGRKRYTSSVISETALESLRIRREDLWFLVEEHPEIGKTIIDRLARMVSPRWTNAHTQIELLLDSHTKKKARKP